MATPQYRSRCPRTQLNGLSPSSHHLPPVPSSTSPKLVLNYRPSRPIGRLPYGLLYKVAFNLLSKMRTQLTFTQCFRDMYGSSTQNPYCLCGLGRVYGSQTTYMIPLNCNHAPSPSTSPHASRFTFPLALAFLSPAPLRPGVKEPIGPVDRGSFRTFVPSFTRNNLQTTGEPWGSLESQGEPSLLFPRGASPGTFRGAMTCQSQFRISFMQLFHFLLRTPSHSEKAA
jgi:hypothetical protein